MVKYDENYFKDKIISLGLANSFMNLKYNKTIIDFSSVWSNTKVPSKEAELYNSIIEIFHNLNDKFLQDLNSFGKVGEKLTTMDNFLKNDVLRFAELDGVVLEVDEIVQTERDKEREAKRRRGFLPVEPDEDTDVYRVDSSIAGYMGNKYDVSFIDNYKSIIVVRDGKYYLYIDSSNYDSGKDLDKELKKEIGKLLRDNLGGFAGGAASAVVNGLKYTEGSNYIRYDLSGYIGYVDVDSLLSWTQKVEVETDE